MIRVGIMAALLAPAAGATDTVHDQYETALSQLAKGRYAQAQMTFDSVLHLEDDPPDLPTLVETYEEAANDYLDQDRRTTRFAYAETGIGRYRVNETPATQAGERDSLFANARVGGGVDHRLDNGYALDANVDYRYREHAEPGVRDDRDLRWRLGGSRAGETRQWSGGLRGRVSYRGNGDHRNDVSVFTVLDRRIDAVNQLRFGAEIRRRSYPQGRLRERSRSTADASVRWTRALNDKARLSTMAHVGRNYATRRPDGESSFHGVTLELDYTINTRLAWNAFGSWEHDAYNADAIRFHPDENDVAILQRNDDLYELGARVVWRFAEGWTFRPEVLYTRDESNILNFNYSATEYWINVRKSF
jgi:hypothetical protein